MNVIEVNRLTHDFGDGKGIFDLSFNVEEGEIFGFLGPNGAGKTTTIRHLMGFLRPQRGSCSIGGSDCFNESQKIQNRLGYLPGEINLFDEMSGSGFLRFLKNYRGIKDCDRTQELLDRFELNPKGKIKKMSKGTKQKIAIVAAFMHDPEILILDEPTSGLDPLMQNRFIELLEEERQKGKTILLSSHIFEEVERTCRRVAILRTGCLAAMDSVTALKSRRTKKFLLTFTTAEEARCFAAAVTEELKLHQNRIEISVSQNINEFLCALSHFQLDDLSEIPQNLEEIFMHYYEDSQK